jgi:hypothetical protein
MTSLEILNQLLKGNHLEPKELERAEKIVHSITQELKSRTKEASK